MRSFFYRLLFRSITTGAVVFALLLIGVPGASLAEWYVAGYGGLSVPGSLSNVKMDTYGERLALQQFPGAAAIPPLGTLTQSFKTSDIGLKHSPLFGGKAGYFFKDEGFNWLGVELEAFTSQPTIKNQRVSTSQEATYLPFDPNVQTPLASCTPGIIDCQAQVRDRKSTRLNSSHIQKSRMPSSA